MNNERISIPELLFHPNDMGIHNRGLPELVKEAIDAAPADLHPFMYSNVFVAGGNAQLPNFCNRLYATSNHVMNLRSCNHIQTLSHSIVFACLPFAIQSVRASCEHLPLRNSTFVFSRTPSA
jgi:actin-related protein